MSLKQHIIEILEKEKWMPGWRATNAELESSIRLNETINRVIEKVIALKEPNLKDIEAYFAHIEAESKKAQDIIKLMKNNV